MIDHVTHIILAHAAGATRTPEEAITVLNVLPCHDAVLSAVLSRGFLEFNPALAIMHGHGLALVPHYPYYVLLNDLYGTLKVAFVLGHLPTIELLWKLAGPNSCGRLTWAEHGCHFVDLALASGSLDVLDWFDRVATEANFEINWDRAGWYTPARKGLFHVFRWGIEHGHLKALTPALVLRSAQSNDLSLICGWLADQPDMADAIVTLKRELKFPYWFEDVSVSTLEWWWTHIAGGTELPEPEKFAEIVNACFYKQDIAFLEWWWALFLQHRTPKHTFGTGDLVRFYNGWDFPIANAEWLWEHSHSTNRLKQEPAVRLGRQPEWLRQRAHRPIAISVELQHACTTTTCRPICALLEEATLGSA
ncbi:hypothetical protein BC828DRAFT_406103 [Blastocladiella britannica]|nr:hypothetical protein BC828DRAFT_406103 [Blastocladiella britannica]